MLTPTAFLDSIGFWGPRTLAAHAVHVTPADIEILARRHVGVAHNPESNMKLASGIAPVEAMRKAGIAVGLGTDGAASNNDLDMFEAMRQAAFLAKLVAGDPRAIPAPRGARDGDHRRGAGAGHGEGDRLARARQARRPDRRLDDVGAADADVRSGFAPRLRHARRRRPDHDRQRQGADARSPRAHPGSAAGARRGASASPTRFAPPSE